MDQDQMAEVQTAFSSDVTQLKLTCGTQDVLRALCLLSETCLSYAEGMEWLNTPLHVSSGARLWYWNLWCADIPLFDAVVVEQAGRYCLELLHLVFKPGYVRLNKHCMS